MAIKISGNTVIDDSRNFCNLNTVTATCYVGDASGITGITPVEVLQPENTSPADGATAIGETPTLCGSQYFSLYDKTHTCSCFQVSECSDFSDCNVFTCEIAGACREITLPSGCLSTSTQHFFRLRYEDPDGCCSEFSDATCFTTAASFFPDLGESACGGFYMGTICAAGSCYYLIMAPNATGCACCIWKTTRTNSGIGDEQCDGYGNTYDHLANATHPAGNWTATRSIGSFSDWYLPAELESLQLYTNKACAPAGEGFKESGPFDLRYWTSTQEVSNIYPQVRRFDNGSSSQSQPCTAYTVRAIRRVVFP